MVKSMIVLKEIEINGKTFSLEAGRFARQANGAVMVSFGDTKVLAVAVAADEQVEGQDFLPLSVEYREKYSAVGKIPGGFIKREGKPTEKEILSARLIDRPIRPLFPKGYMTETQVIVQVYSSDQEHDPDVIGAVGASAALAISDIPFEGPIGEVRVCLIGDQFVVNPTYKEIEEAKLEIVVAGTEDSILMVEGEAKEVSEETMLEAIKFGHEYIKQLVALQKELVEEVGKTKRAVQLFPEEEEIIKAVRELCYDKINQVIHTPSTKEVRRNSLKQINLETVEALKEKFPEREFLIKSAIHDLERELMRKMILEEGVRLDGRGTRDIRPIYCEVGLLPRTHGSALFTRGETQSLTTLTLGTKLDEQLVEGLLPEETTKKFMLHYNFPAFSVGEIGRYTGPGRREIGHGNLAERSLKNLLPKDEEFPYTIRVVSDILESNGSSSMATVCAGSLALMDGGVPLKKPVAGIAMGLILENGKYKILSDILGDEDHLGDMDFKVAGTEDGITGFQMDIKVKGISYEIMAEALAQAKEGRLFILSKMNETLSAPRSQISKYAPHLVQIKIPIDKIGAVIGPSGKIIQSIQRDTKTEIAIEENGVVNIASTNEEGIEEAISRIRLLTEPPQIGKVYKATVKRIVDFGAFVEIAPGVEGLLHISQIDHKKVNKIEDYFKVGEKIEVKLIKIEDNGRLVFSRKILIPPPEAPKSQPPKK
ncbi:MAG: polyribonucleotide nucleotidyltransferase [Ignavibacteria bacterium]|jgi:polyribonucleotide nucleotidyltransferase|nr:polyribonucleotide nucleotidyltransferase [Ignavibacteria bacterium]MDH7527701.1 polyribonucleotide nucleotidyltransferase [Ignavibacteria bacterium]